MIGAVAEADDVPIGPGLDEVADASRSARTMRAIVTSVEQEIAVYEQILADKRVHYAAMLKGAKKMEKWERDARRRAARDAARAIAAEESSP